MTRFMLAVAMLAFLAAPAAAATRRAFSGSFQGTFVAPQPLDHKLDPALRYVLGYAGAANRGLAAEARRLEALARPSSPFSVLIDPMRAEPDVLAFVKLGAKQDAARLREAGAELMAQVEDIAVARIPVSRVAEVAALEPVRYVELATRSQATLDSSRVRSGVADVHQGIGLPQAFTGEGVVVGVLDGGLDYKHADFRTGPGTGPGTSRVRALRDYGSNPTATNGIECRPGQLDSLTCPEKDGSGGEGHGTHVTGTAAGGGRENLAYIGMAPDADLMFVKGIRDPESNGGFSDADVTAGAQFIFDRARALGQPCVLNLSLGGQLGAHDGTSLYEQSLDALTGPGRIIVAAAGNSGATPIHCSYPVQGTSFNDALETPLLTFVNNQTTGVAVVDLWYPAGTSISVGIAAYDPTDPTSPVFVSNAAPPGQVLQGTAMAGSTPLGNIAIDARTVTDPNNGARRVLIVFQDAGGSVRLHQVLWTIYTFGAGTPDLWAAIGGAFPDLAGAPSWFRPGDNAKTIGSPASARRLIAVGSHVTKTQWVDVTGATQNQPNATLDAISGFSSRGPTRDGRVLPHLTAPGEAILAALSQDFTPPDSRILEGGGLQKLQGTSMAAPHVTGVVALMLQRDPALTPEDARTILQQTAVDAGAPGQDPVFGAGRLDAQAALIATPDGEPCSGPAPFLRASRDDCEELARGGVALQVHPNPVAGIARVAFRLPAPEHVHLAVYDLAGRRVRVLRDAITAAGPHQLSWDGDDDRGLPVPSGVYLTRMLTPSKAEVRRVVVVR